jgi:glycerol uptake facilitator protein
MTQFLGEMVGTALLLLLGDGVVANVLLKDTKGHAGGWIVIAAGWGVAVYVAAACTAPLTGAHLNPAVTIGLLAAGKLGTTLAMPYLAGQFAGAFVGAVLVYLVYRPHFVVSDSPQDKLGIFCTAPAIRAPVWNLLCEVVGTFVLIFAVLRMSPVSLEWASADPNAAPKLGLGAVGVLPVALVVLGIGLSLGGPTGYAINPARDLAPRLAHWLLPIPGKGRSDWGYAWIPALGPVLGAVLAAIVSTNLPTPSAGG